MSRQKGQYKINEKYFERPKLSKRQEEEYNKTAKDAVARVEKAEAHIAEKAKWIVETQENI